MKIIQEQAKREWKNETSVSNLSNAIEKPKNAEKTQKHKSLHNKLFGRTKDLELINKNLVSLNQANKVF